MLHKAIIAVRAEIQNPMAEIIQLQKAEMRQLKAELAAQKAREDAELQRQIEKEQVAAEALSTRTFVMLQKQKFIWY